MSTDEIVVERSWRSGVEIVARVNWSHIARVRRALGLVDNAVGSADAPWSERFRASDPRMARPALANELRAA